MMAPLQILNCQCHWHCSRRQSLCLTLFEECATFELSRADGTFPLNVVWTWAGSSGHSFYVF